MEFRHSGFPLQLRLHAPIAQGFKFTGQQQDAQEFSNLFLTLLEDALSRQRDQWVRNIIQNQFRGEYAYVTTCNTMY
jgi:ubiquitin C-terminal hydrolase